MHRTFAGYTRARSRKPEIILSVLGRTEILPFGFPEFQDVDFDAFAHDGFALDEATRTLFINLVPKSSTAMRVRLKGFLTWDRERHGLSAANKNTGLILSVRGIPYFMLDLAEYGATTIPTARPGSDRTCLVVECDSIQDDMNISRSALVDSPKTQELKDVVSQLLSRVESSELYLAFRRMPEQDKVVRQGGILADEKRQIEQADQNWVVLDRGNGDLRVLLREPRNETEVSALTWKLEALSGLPFETFSTLAYVGAKSGPDLLAHFQEDRSSEPFRATVIELENNFYNYKTHGHVPTQYPKVICWDVPTSGRKAKINRTAKPYKFTLSTDEYQVHIYAIKYMDGVKVMTREELRQRGVDI